MTFTEFAILYGLILPDLYPSERVRRCPTEQHPRTKDGAYFWYGRVAGCQTGQTARRSSGTTTRTRREADKRAAERKRAQERRQAEVHSQAAITAAAMLSACKPAEHKQIEHDN